MRGMEDRKKKKRKEGLGVEREEEVTERSSRVG